MTGTGSPDHYLSEAEVRRLIEQALAQVSLAGKRILVIIPDSTRTAPIPWFFRLFHELLDGRAAALDYLVALGTHSAMSEAALNKLVGISTEERAERYPNVRIFNHHWDQPDTFTQVGTIPEEEIAQITEGRLKQSLPVAPMFEAK